MSLFIHRAMGFVDTEESPNIGEKWGSCEYGFIGEKLAESAAEKRPVISEKD